MSNFTGSQVTYEITVRNRVVPRFRTRFQRLAAGFWHVFGNASFSRLAFSGFRLFSESSWGCLVFASLSCTSQGSFHCASLWPRFANPRIQEFSPDFASFSTRFGCDFAIKQGVWANTSSADFQRAKFVLLHSAGCCHMRQYSNKALQRRPHVHVGGCLLHPLHHVLHLRRNERLQKLHRTWKLLPSTPYGASFSFTLSFNSGKLGAITMTRKRFDVIKAMLSTETPEEESKAHANGRIRKMGLLLELFGERCKAARRQPKRDLSLTSKQWVASRDGPRIPS